MYEWTPKVEHKCWRCKRTREYAPAEVVVVEDKHLKDTRHFVRCSKCKALTQAEEAIVLS